MISNYWLKWNYLKQISLSTLKKLFKGISWIEIFLEVAWSETSLKPWKTRMNDATYFKLAPIGVFHPRTQSFTVIFYIKSAFPDSILVSNKWSFTSQNSFFNMKFPSLWKKFHAQASLGYLYPFIAQSVDAQAPLECLYFRHMSPLLLKTSTCTTLNIILKKFNSFPVQWPNLNYLKKFTGIS